MQHRQNVCGGRFLSWQAEHAMVAIRSGGLRTGAAQSSQPDMCQYRRFRVAITYARDSYLAFPTTRAAFLKSAMIPPCCQSQPFFINQAGGISGAVLVFRRFQLRFTLTTIWYSVNVPVHDTNKRCSHYASCLSRSSWNSQLGGIVRWQPIFIAQASTLHRKTYISPVHQDRRYGVTTE